MNNCFNLQKNHQKKLSRRRDRDRSNCQPKNPLTREFHLNRYSRFRETDSIYTRIARLI